MTGNHRIAADVAFGPDATRAMGAAFDKACRSLQDGDQANVVREIIAKRIIDLALDGERDPDHLCEASLRTLGFARNTIPAGDAEAVQRRVPTSGRG
jgi:hypothetical protein